MGWFGDNDNREAVGRQFEYDTEMWQFNEQQQEDAYQFKLDQWAIDKWNTDASIAYKNETAINDWKYRQDMREFDYQNQIEAYNASVQNYERQMDYNNIAAELTNSDNTRKYNEKLIAIGYQNEELVQKFDFDTRGLTEDYKFETRGMTEDQALEARGMTLDIQAKRAEKAFQSQQLRIDSIQKTGQVRATGAVGRSSRRGVQSVMASFGMQQAALQDAVLRDDARYEFGMEQSQTKYARGMDYAQTKYARGMDMAEAKLDIGRRQLQDSMKSATAQHEADKQHVLLQKYNADMQAENAIAPAPVLPPEMPAPLALPTPKTLKPHKGGSPPKPIKGAIQQGPNLIGHIINAISDDRLKYDITRVGTSPSGVPEYTFKYRLDGEHGPTYKGTSAQDLLAMGRKDAVGMTEKDGFYYVDYSKLDVKMEKVQLA